MNLDPSSSTRLFEQKHASPLLCCAFDPTGRFLLAGGRDRALLGFDVASRKSFALEGHESWVVAAVRCGSELVLTADYTGRVIGWDCSGEKPRPRWNIAAHANTVHALAASVDGRRFATGDRDGTIRIWQAADGAQLREISGLGHPVTALAFLPDEVRLVSADRQPKKPRLKWWNLSTGEELRSIEVPELSGYRRVEDIEWGGIRAVAVSPDGKTLVGCGEHFYAGPGAAFVFDAETGERKRRLASSLKGFCYAAAFHPDGFLATASGDVGKGEFRTWDVTKEEPLSSTATPGPCTSLDIHPDGTRFAVTQTIGKGSYPDSGMLALYAWESGPAIAE